MSKSHTQSPEEMHHTQTDVYRAYAATEMYRNVEKNSIKLLTDLERKLLERKQILVFKGANGVKRQHGLTGEANGLESTQQCPELTIFHSVSHMKYLMKGTEIITL